MIRRLFALMGRSFERAHLEMARNSLTLRNPMHPDLPWIVTRLRELEQA